MSSMQNCELRIIDYIPEFKLRLRLECDPKNYIDRFVIINGFWELGVITALGALIRPGDVCIDVGANAGYISVVMGRYTGASGRVISFEPNAEVTAKFLRNLSLNPDLKPVVELKTMGLGTERAHMFVVLDTGAGMGNAVLSASASNNTSHPVEVITLDSLNLPRLDCMKVDVEGMELDVLSGATRTISRFLPNIVFETLTNLPPEQHKPLEEYLRNLGYRIYSFDAAHGRFEEIGYPRYPQDDSYAIHPNRAQVAALAQ
jgi:FkbM family methyltransferase